MKALGKSPPSLDLKPRQERGIYTELQDLINKMRINFGETATKGMGSFSFYIGHLKRIPIDSVKRWFDNVKDSPKLDADGRCRVFWWHYKQYKKRVINKQS